MEAHTGALTLPGRRTERPRRHWLRRLRQLIRARRESASLRAYSARGNRSLPTSIAGSEHTHLLRRPRGF
jgi:hypothetical protein